MAAPASHIPEASSPARSPRCPQSKDRSTHLSEDETLSARSSALAAIHHKDTKSRVPCRGYLTRAPPPEAARLVGRGQPRRRDVPLHLCHCPQVVSACRTRKRIARPFCEPAQRPEAVVALYQMARRESQRLSGDRAAGRRSRSAVRPIHCRLRADRCQAPEWRPPAYRDCAVEGVEHIIDRLAGRQQQDGELATITARS